MAAKIIKRQTSKHSSNTNFCLAKGTEPESDTVSEVHCSFSGSTEGRGICSPAAIAHNQKMQTAESDRPGFLNKEII